MDRLERVAGLTDAIIQALSGWQAGVWTALPATISSFDAEKMTCVAQPTIQMQRRNPDGSREWVTLPPILDVVVLFPGGGDFTLTFPVQAGDECLLIFSARCIDGWWQSGAISPQLDLRMHDLSDGFALVGVRSQPRKLSPAVSTTAVELRSDDDAVHIKVDAGQVEIIAPAIKLGGTVQKLVSEAFVSFFNAHVHTDPQGGSTGAPTVAMGAGQLTSKTKAE